MDTLDELKSTGLKATLPRLKILEVFQKSEQRHMTAEDVFKLLLAEGADIGLATVYRVLTQFEQAHILKRNHFESGKAIYELADDSHHDHLVCLSCGKEAVLFEHMPEGSGERYSLDLTKASEDTAFSQRLQRVHHPLR